MKDFLNPSIPKIFIILLISFSLLGLSYFFNIQGIGNFIPNSSFSSNPTLVPNANQEKIHVILRADENTSVEVDGKNALTYKVEEVRGHCDWNIFEMVLDKGSHTLAVVNNTKQTSNRKEFILESELWFNIVPYTDPINIFQSNEPLLCE